VVKLVQAVESLTTLHRAGSDLRRVRRDEFVAETLGVNVAVWVMTTKVPLSPTVRPGLFKQHEDFLRHDPRAVKIL
jgi:hypothetical protein